MVKELTNKYTVNARDSRGNTPLIIVSGFGHEDIAEYLIKKGAEVNAKNNSGCTPLMRACEDGKINMVKLLVKYGADVNAKTKYGTPLTSTEDEDIEEYLISKGAKIY